MKPEKSLTKFRLIMMCVVAIDSLKNLPTNALYGSHLIFYYLLAVLAFFIPSALVSAELASSWPLAGGIYIWVREAFGKQMAFLAVWIQWLTAIIWYPSILSFIAATLAYFYSPDLAANKIYIFISIELIFWGAIYIVSKGLHISSLVSTLSAVFGVLLPMLFFTILSVCWLYSGHPSHSTRTHAMVNTDNLRLFITLIYSLMGIEIIAAHASEVKNPQKDFSQAILIAAVLILATVIPSSLAIAIVVPFKDISLTTGVIEAFVIFLSAFHLDWIKPMLIVSLAIGGFGIFLTWLLASTRCLLVVAKDGSLPAFLQKTNRQGVPIIQLTLQGIIFSILSSAFIFLPSVNSAFWFLTAAAAQFALLYYLFLFVAAIRLRSKYPDINRPFRAGKSSFVFRLVCGMGGVTCLSVFFLGFIPPPEISADRIFLYELLLVGLTSVGCGLGLVIYRLSQPKVDAATFEY